jgi:hypothetical protein
MSLFSWFSPRKNPEPPASMMPSSGLSRMDSTKPFNASRMAGSAQPANRKHERMARRELLYSVVRESMVRAGVLSSSYKFKVLSLDARGRQFLVMVDLAQGAGNDTTRLAEIEAMVAQSAKNRHDILVTAVYWRSNEHVVVGEPAAPRQAAVLPRVLQPAPLAAERPARPVAPIARAVPPVARAPVVSRPAPLETESRPVELQAAPPKFEPLHPEEVAAFQRVLAASVKGEKALAASALAGDKPVEQSYTLLTGFEDTEMVGEPSQLSGTQYGELR